MPHRGVSLVVHTDITARKEFDERFNAVVEQLLEHGVTHADLVFFGDSAQAGEMLFDLTNRSQTLALPNLGHGDNLLAGLALSHALGANCAPSLVIVFHHLVFDARGYLAVERFLQGRNNVRYLLMVCSQESGVSGAGFAGVTVEQLGRKRAGMCSYTRQEPIRDQLNTVLGDLLSIN